MSRFKELCAVIGEKAISAIERTHALDFVVGLSTHHAGILDKMGAYLGGPYGALSAIVVAYCLFTMASSFRLQKRTTTPMLPHQRLPQQKRWFTFIFRFHIDYPPKPKNGGRRRRKKSDDVPPNTTGEN